MQYEISFKTDFRCNPYKGKFIVIEGVDGSGKTTQALNLVNRLKGLGHKVVYTKEPTDESTGQFIRENVLSGKVKIPNIAIQYLIAADRAVHHEKIENYLKEGYTVVSDRYFWSAVAYGLGDKGSDFDKNGQLLLASLSILSMYHRFIIPDLTFYLQVLVDTAIQRIQHKKARIEIYEKREKLDKIARGYEWLVKEFPKEFVVIDGERGVEEVGEEIVSRLSA